MSKIVEIYLNANTRSSFAFGYQPGDTLVLAHSYEVACPGEAPKAINDLDLAESAFELFNVGDERGDPIALAYRAKRHRSLSKGDVVVIISQEGPLAGMRRAYACASTGWLTLDESAKLRIGKYRCDKAGCRQEFDSDADRYEHYENTGHVGLYY